VAEALGDAMVARREPLGASRSIEVVGHKTGEVTCRRVGEKIALRLDAAGRENRDVFARSAPASKRGGHVGDFKPVDLLS